jgi:hypothetical protein
MPLQDSLDIVLEPTGGVPADPRNQCCGDVDELDDRLAIEALGLAQMPRDSRISVKVLSE